MIKKDKIISNNISDNIISNNISDGIISNNISDKIISDNISGGIISDEILENIHGGGSEIPSDVTQNMYNCIHYSYFHEGAEDDYCRCYNYDKNDPVCQECTHANASK